MMRIVFPMLTRFPSKEASAVQVANMAQAFAELGHEVLVIVPARDTTATSATSVQDEVEQLFGFRPAFDVQALSRRVHRGQSYPHAVRIARIARPSRTDLFFSRNLRSCLIPAMRGVPTVFEAHTVTDLLGPQERWVLRRLRRAPGFLGFVAISQGLADDLGRDLGIPHDRILVAHDAVRVRTAAPAAPPRAADGRISVGYTGSMFAGRGVELLVALAERDERVVLHLVGRPAEAAAVWAAGAPRALSEGRIVIHGFVSPARSQELQQGFDVLVAPFGKQVLTDSGVDSSRWMSPMKVFEYMASGRPIVTSDLPVLREVLRPDVDAVMIPPDDLDALCVAIDRLAEDPALGARLAASAFERARDDFTWDARAARILDRFASPLQGRSARGGR